MVQGPELVQHVLLKKEKKSYWNTATSICVCIIYDCFHASVAEVKSCDRDRMVH